MAELGTSDATGRLGEPSVTRPSETSSTTISLLPADQTADASPSDATEELERLRREHAELQRRYDEQRRQNRGAQEEARRLAERIATIEGHLTATAADRRTAQTIAQQVDDPDDLTETELNDILNRWVNNDQSGLKTLLKKLKPKTSVPTEAITEAQVREWSEKASLDKLVEIGTIRQLQDIVSARHPDMGNPQSAMSRAVWERYDDYQADPGNQMLYPKEAKAEVPMIGPDGSTKMVNARLVDRMCADIEKEQGVATGRRDEARDAATGAVQGSGSRRGGRPVVEAVDLLTPGERTMLQDPKIQRGWPGMPKDLKAAAKFFLDQDPADRDRRARAYVDAQGRGR